MLVRVRTKNGADVAEVLLNGLPAVKHLFDSREDLEEIIKTLTRFADTANVQAKPADTVNVQAKYVYTGLGIFKDMIRTKKDLDEKGMDIANLVNFAGINAGTFVTKSLVRVRETLGPDKFKEYWSDIIKFCNALRENCYYAFEYGFPAISHMIESREDFNRLVGDLVQIGQLCAGAGEMTFKSIYDISDIIKQYPNSWSTFVKPVIFNM